MVVVSGTLSVQAASDVAEAIAYYRENGRISQPLMEASIFRRPYFVGHFLPSLLSPSLTAHEGRKGLISALVRSVYIHTCIQCLNLQAHDSQREEDSTAHAEKL